MRALRAALLGLALGACHAQKPPISLAPPLGDAPYEEVLDAWTREDRVYDRLESRIFATATFHSPSFRRAFLMRREDFSGPGSEEARRLSLTDSSAEEGFEFFLSVSTPTTDWNDLDEPDSIWRVSLVTEDGRTSKAKITRVKPNANVRAIYTYITDYAFTYSVRFPLTDDTGAPIIGSATRQIRLELASSVGKASLVWDLVPLVHAGGSD
ncbi:MAG: hypothetical protein HYV07_18045 [Deltaproteobacteria bacterium]|nr:hypothetical protein [Deltaproteobacteria bacterium]